MGSFGSSMLPPEEASCFPSGWQLQSPEKDRSFTISPGWLAENVIKASDRRHNEVSSSYSRLETQKAAILPAKQEDKLRPISKKKDQVPDASGKYQGLKMIMVATTNFERTFGDISLPQICYAKLREQRQFAAFVAIEAPFR
jgi:hypothetical protein